MKGVILAAGHGRRLLPLTSFRPKHMLPVAGKPILHHSLEYLRDVLDIKDIIIVVGYERQAIMDYFKNGEELGINITYVVQYAEKIKGLAWILRRPRITVNIGRPFYLPSSGRKLTKPEIAEITDTIMGHIAELLPPEYRGSYSK